MEALDNHAWALLCAVESGQLPLEAYDEEISATLDEAQRLAATGSNIVGTRALYLALRGQPDEGAALAGEALAWRQSDDDRANNLLTLAVAYADSGHPDQARAAFDEAKELDPENPRLPAVEKRVLAEPIPG